MAEGAERSLSALSDHARATAMARLQVLRPHLEDGVPLARAAAAADVAPRTATRWLAAYRGGGLVGLASQVAGRGVPR
jgi:putative transposase